MDKTNGNDDGKNKKNGYDIGRYGGYKATVGRSSNISVTTPPRRTQQNARAATAGSSKGQQNARAATAGSSKGAAGTVDDGAITESGSTSRENAEDAADDGAFTNAGVCGSCNAPFGAAEPVEDNGITDSGPTSREGGRGR